VVFILRQLIIQNLALIDELCIDFERGLNILTGETGAGKSIIIDAVILVLGERADRELIQTGKDFARVEGIFDIQKLHGVQNALAQYGIDPEEDGTLILMREISLSGRNICRVNGRSVTLSMLKEISKHLVDVHGQHEHQSLLSVESHLRLLDRMGGNEVAKLKEQVDSLYTKWKAVEREIDLLLGNGRDMERRKDLLFYQIDEIARANLKPGEDEELLRERSLLQNAEKIMDVIHQAYNQLYSGDQGRMSVSDILGQLITRFSQISHLDKHFDNMTKQLESIYYQLEDVIIDLRDYKESFDFDPSRLDELEKRLTLIESIKRKYGKTIEEVLDFKKKLEAEAASLENIEQRLDELERQKQGLLKDLVEACSRLSDLRRNIARRFEKQLVEQLRQLGMEKSKFRVDIQSPGNLEDLDHFDTDRITRQGFDMVEFMISPNPGEPLKPLAKIVSGGEMSRIMLAFKTILAGLDDIPVLIFDEIDVGISGRMAQVVAEKMGDISRTRQVICVTHLPQIAAMADNHFLIEKVFIEDRTRTKVHKLTRDHRKEEVARMVGGATVSQLSLAHAEELLDSAEDYKKGKRNAAGL